LPTWASPSWRRGYEAMADQAAPGVPTVFTQWADQAAFAATGSLQAAATIAKAEVSKLNAYAVLVRTPAQGAAAFAAVGTLGADPGGQGGISVMVMG
jgi:hypothetical protein